jgi:hypothetical protein
MEIDAPEIHILELDGFLNALRCLIGHPAKVFGAGYIEKVEQDLDSIINDKIKFIEKSGCLVSRDKVDFKYIQKIFSQYIYNRLPTENENILGNLDWNLVEYYGLASTAENEDGEWNRLVSQEHIILEYKDENSIDSVIFFVEHDKFVIATYL